MLGGCKEEYTPYRGSGAGGAAPVFKNEGTDSGTQKPAGNYVGRVALTFDDGPHNTYTKAIVDELASYGFNATFFVIGNRVDGSAYNGAEAMKYAASKGNEIAIHAYTHSKYYDTCTEEEYSEELSKTHAVITKHIPNASVKLMRPVGGRMTDARIESSKYSVIHWSVDSEDWKYKQTSKENVDIIVEGIMDGVENGDIILMHDIYENTLEATKEVLKQLDEKGLEVVTVSELLGSSMTAGKMYYYKSKNS